MANRIQFDLLKQGVEAWNAWRIEHPEIRPDLSYVDLGGANLSGADLSRANLSGAFLIGVDLSRADLREANLNKAQIGWTIFGDVDLRTIKGLETVKHRGPSTIGTNTISRSEGDIPDVFLRGAGVTDTFIAYANALLQHPTDYYTCFISYSSKDRDFAQRLYDDLQSNGVRCWFALKT